MTLTDTPIDFLITRPPAEGSPLRGFPRPACGSDSVGWPANGAGISPSRLREPDPGEPRYSGLFVLVEGPEKKAADALARIPEYLVVVGERVLGYKGTADAEAEVLRVVENGTTAADIAVYRRRPVEVETAFEVRIESVEEDGDRVTAGKRRAPRETSAEGRRRAPSPAPPVPGNTDPPSDRPDGDLEGLVKARLLGR